MLYPQSYTCESPPYARVNGGGEVEIYFQARADLDYNDEWINVDINYSDFDESLGGPTLGRLFRVGGNTGCRHDPDNGVSGINPVAKYNVDALFGITLLTMILTVRYDLIFQHLPLLSAWPHAPAANVGFTPMRYFPGYR